MNSNDIEVSEYLAEVQKRADKLIDKFIFAFFAIGIALSPIYETWGFSLLVGGMNLGLYLIGKFIKNKFIGRQIISMVFSVFMLQFIGQMHGMAEMHFFFFTNITILIIYQDWRMMIPYTLFAIIHHSTFFYFQLLGYDHLGQYFINYAEVDVQLLFFHFGLVILMGVIAGWWSILFRQRSIRMMEARQEVNQQNEELTQSLDALEQTQQALATAQKNLRGVLENTGVGIWKYSEKSREVTLDKKSCELFHVAYSTTPHVISLQDWLQILHPEDTKDVQRFMRSLLDGNSKNSEIEYRIAPNGQKAEHHLVKVAVEQSTDGTRQELIGTVQDISQRKELEQMVHLQNQDLQQSLNQVVMLREESESEKNRVEKLFNNMQRSINYAWRIQQATLPSLRELQEELPSSFIVYQPRDVVSGDFFWVAKKQDTFILAVGDCTGHGVPGALMTMVANDILNQIVHNLEVHDPAEIMNLIPQLLEDALSHSEKKIPDGMDMGIVAITKHESYAELSFAGAMNPLYRVENHGDIEVIAGDKLPIGGKRKLKNQRYQRYSYRVEKPTMFYLASDGYQDQFGGPRDRKFLKKHFRELLHSIAALPIEEQEAHLREVHQAWKGDKRQTDDIIIIGFKLM